MSLIVEYKDEIKGHGTYSIKVEAQIETSTILMLVISVKSLVASKIESPLFITIDILNYKSDLASKIVVETIVSCLAYCAGKKVVTEALKCIANGSDDTKKLIECMKNRNQQITFDLAKCFIKCSLGAGVD